MYNYTLDVLFFRPKQFETQSAHKSREKNIDDFWHMVDPPKNGRHEPHSGPKTFKVSPSMVVFCLKLGTWEQVSMDKYIWANYYPIGSMYGIFPYMNGWFLW